MKNLYTKNEFLNLRQDEMLNEGLLGKMFKFLWTSTVKLAKKIKGSKEIDVVYDKYKKIIDSTFSKMTNVEHVVPGAAGQTAPTTNANTNNTNANANTNPNNTNANANANANNAAPKKENFKYSEIYEVNTNQPNQEQNNLSKLNPEQIKKFADLTTKQIENEKRKFENEINAIVTKLSKNPDYSSDKLIQYGIVKKNEFDSYVYDQWHNLYQKVGDQKKLAEVDKIKKQRDETFKQSIDELTTKVGGQQMQIGKGGQYLYHSDTENKDITVEVIGDLGKDENGKPDAADPNHNNMYKVKNTASGNNFWVDSDSLKKQIKAGKPAAANQLASNIKKGETYKRKVTSKNSPNVNKFINVTVKDINKKAGTATVSTGKSTFQSSLSALKPLKTAAPATIPATTPATTPAKTAKKTVPLPAKK